MVDGNKKGLPHEALNVEFIKTFSFFNSQFLFPQYKALIIYTRCVI